MKQKDIALIIVIVAVGGALSFVISNKFISSPDHNEKAAKESWDKMMDFMQANLGL